MSAHVTRQQRRALEREFGKRSNHGPNPTDGPNRKERKSFRRLVTDHADRQPRIFPLIARKGIGGPSRRKRSRR